MRVARIGGSYYSTLLVDALLTFAFHELAHWSAGELLGYKMVMSLNHAHLRSGAFARPPSVQRRDRADCSCRCTARPALVSTRLRPDAAGTKGRLVPQSLQPIDVDIADAVQNTHEPQVARAPEQH